MQVTSTSTRFKRAPANLLCPLLHRIATLILTISTVLLSIDTVKCDAIRRNSGVPNIVLILSDDLGYGDVGCFGDCPYETPNLDRMAEGGVRLTNFYVPMPYCAPSRATILTGRYPFRHGLVHNPCPDARPENDLLGLNLDEITLADTLKEAGYATACIGKWHLGHQPRFLPRKRGFDEYLGILYSNDMRPVELIENETVVEYPVVQALLTKKYTERALSFIEKNKDRPFFLYMPHAMPHKPLAASEEFYKKSGAGLYGDVIAELDWSVGQVLAKLDELGLDGQTLVVFTSDNGPWFGGSSGGLRGMKGQQWEGGIRVPMIARWPGRIPAGQVTNAPAGTVDVFPTVAKLAGAKLPDDRVIDGLDIMPVLASGAASPHEALIAMSGPKSTTIMGGRWKLHVIAPSPWPRNQINTSDWVDPRGPDGVTIIAPYEQATPLQHPDVQTGEPGKNMMLIDLEADPSEQHDVSAEHPEVVKRLKGLFDELAAQSQSRRDASQ